MVRKLTLTVAMIALLGSALPALSQTAGPNGGMLAGKGDHQTELLVSANDLTVYLLDNGKPHDTKGVSIKGVVQQGGKNTTIAFAEEVMLRAKAMGDYVRFKSTIPRAAE